MTMPIMRLAGTLILASVLGTGPGAVQGPPETQPAASSAPAPPTPLFVDIGRIAEVRRRLPGDPRLQAAVATLEQDARKALDLAPVSVMDKGVVPPSGDRHDYMSQAPYWWPDPARPSGRPYIRRDGERNPEIDAISDHAQFGRLMSAVSTLGLAYAITGRDAYASHAVRLVRVWFLEPATRMNPHLRYGQGIPGITEGRGIGIIETRGLPDLVDGIALLKGSAAWTAHDQDGLDAWMRAYLAWLRESPHGREEATNGNNHETWYDVQVASLALATGQRDVARATLEGARTRIATQIAPDGRQPRELERTRAWHYSLFNLDAFFRLAMLGERLGVDLWAYQTADGRSLRKAIDFLAPFAAGDRPWPYKALARFDPEAFHALLRRASLAWKAPEYAVLARRLGGGGNRLDVLLP